MVNFWNNDVLFWTPLYQSTKYESRIDSKNLNTFQKQFKTNEVTRRIRQFQAIHPPPDAWCTQKRQAISQSGKI